MKTYGNWLDYFPLIRKKAELKEVLSRHSENWIIAKRLRNYNVGRRRSPSGR